MVAPALRSFTLETFLDWRDRDDSPAWEYADGQVWQKPMPKLRHSILQKRLLRAIDGAGDHYTALPELRCTFGGRSIVPDVAVVAWERIPLGDRGEPADNFTAVPDWAIEILSSDQSTTRVLDNLLHCLRFGCRLGWLIDPDARSVLVLQGDRPLGLFRDETPLPHLDDLDAQLTAAQIFGWLQIGPK